MSDTSSKKSGTAAQAQTIADMLSPTEAVTEQITALSDKRKTYVTNGARVLHELVELKPKLLAPHVPELVTALQGEHTRSSQMAADALARLARVAPAKVAKSLETLTERFDDIHDTGKDGIVRTFANLCISSVAYQVRVEPTLIKALRDCDAETLLNWSRTVLPALKGEPHANTREVVELRLNRIPKRIAQQIAEDLNLKLNLRYR